jgi:hypothetical protein
LSASWTASLKASGGCAPAPQHVWHHSSTMRN